LGMQLLKPAPGVAASVGRVIPSTVVHDAPSHKLRSGIMAVPVVVEKIRNCKTPDDHCVPIDRARSAELVLFAFEGLAGASPSEIVLDVGASEIRFGRSGGNAGQLAIGKICDARDIAEPATARDFGV